MKDANLNAPRTLAAVLCLKALTALSGCHEDVKADMTDSATDGADYFTSGAEDTETIPATSMGEPTTGGINPSDFCELHPTEEFPGFVYVCSGEVRGELSFDYFGDPEVPINSMFICTDFTEPPLELKKEPGYVYTCVYALGSFPFGPDLPEPNGHQIDACCLRDSPDEAAEDFCRIDGAEEFCLGGTDGLNEMRMQIPQVPQLAEVNHQLENLNKFLADSDTQTDCAQTMAKGLLSEGDFDGNTAKVVWSIKHPQELDPGAGWPWFRDIRANLFAFEIDSTKKNGLPCNQLEEDALIHGTVAEAELVVRSHLGGASVDMSGGSFSLRRSDCRLDSCELKLETLEMQIEDFEVGSLSFADVSVAMTGPTTGLINDDKIGVSEGLHFTATFRLFVDGEPALDGALVSVGLQSRGVAEALLLQDSQLSVQKIDAGNWPFDLTLVSKLASEN